MSASQTPIARLADLGLRANGTTVNVPRKLIVDVVRAHAKDEGLRPRAALADALTRAISHREASLQSVPVARVAAYLRAKGWAVIAQGGLWSHPETGAVVELPAGESAPGYAADLWRVASDVGGAEKRPAVLVLADWMVG